MTISPSGRVSIAASPGGDLFYREMDVGEVVVVGYVTGSDFPCSDFSVSALVVAGGAIDFCRGGVSRVAVFEDRRVSA